MSGKKAVAHSIHFRVEIVLMAFFNGELFVYLTPYVEEPGVLELPAFDIDTQLDCNLDRAVKRGVAQLLGTEAGYIEQVKTVGNATRRPGEWSVSTLYYGLIAAPSKGQLGDNWFALNQRLKTKKMAYDHLALIYSCFKRLRTQAQYTSLPMYFLQSEFTVYELQQIYENLLDSKFDNKSFRRRFLEAGLLVSLNKHRYGCNRPAQLYCISPQHLVHHFSRKMLGSQNRC